MESSFSSPSPSTPFESRIDLTGLQEAVGRIRREVGKLIVGQQRMVDLLIATVLARGHALIEGVPGVAKTLTARLVARTLDVDFHRIQFTPDLMPSDILGTPVFNPKTATFEFRRGAIFSNVVLIDEINRAPAKTQAALFEVMEERQVTADGVTYPMDEPFLVLATQNPLEHEGTYRLPEAQLDRFLFKINVGYPSLEEEVAILTGHHEGRSPDAINLVQPVLTAAQVAEYRAQVRKLYVEPSLLNYIAQIVHQTRDHQALTLGASPRASVSILLAAKAIAAMRSRDFVSPEDIQEVCGPVLRHRVMLTPEQEMEGGHPDDIIARLIAQVEVPR